MPRNDDLTAFVKEALTRGVPRMEIEDTLRSAGWSPRQVQDALGGFAELSFPIPVPRPQAYTDAREGFLYGVLFVGLGLTAYNLGALAFAFIDQAFPAGMSPRSLGDATRWPISIIIVALPVFLYVSRVIARDIQLDPGRRSSRNRSQTTYITLFICAGIVIGVLAGLVYQFLGGDLTARFILKSLTAIAIAGGIFWYYRRDMQLAGD